MLVKAVTENIPDANGTPAGGLTPNVKELFGRITAKVRLFSYRKVPKYSDTLKICCNHPKIQKERFYHRVMHSKVADSIANSEDPDQTAPLGAV